jgi:hypothetical protein
VGRPDDHNDAAVRFFVVCGDWKAGFVAFLLRIAQTVDVEGILRMDDAENLGPVSACEYR